MFVKLNEKLDKIVQEMNSFVGEENDSQVNCEKIIDLIIMLRAYKKYYKDEVKLRNIMELHEQGLINAKYEKQWFKYFPSCGRKDWQDIWQSLKPVKCIGWLGSSVTYGSAADGFSMVDFASQHEGIVSVKHAVSGTTLVNEDDTSYVSRMKNEMGKNLPLDLLIVQLSTNDATRGFELSKVKEAIETIVEYAKENWNCKVTFYTGTRFDCERYQEMVDMLYENKDTWNIDIIDLWNDADMAEVIGTNKYQEYMDDPIHPTLEGYKKWWMPKFEEYLEISK